MRVENVKNFLYRGLKSKYLPLIVISICYIIFFLMIRTFFGDDFDIHYKVCNPQSAFNWFYWAITEWTTRVFILVLEIVFVKSALSFIVWKIVTAICFVIFIWTIRFLFFSKEKAITLWMLVFFLILCNFDKIFTTAGWVSTTVCYLYPMTAMFISFIPLKINDNRQKVHPLFMFFLLPIVLLAVNAEIFCLFTFLVSFGVCLRSLWKKEHNYYCWILLSMSIASLTFILTSPALSSQYNKCELSYFPMYSQIFLVQKLAMAVVNMFNYIAIVNYEVFLMGTFLNFFIVYKTDRNFWYKIIAFIPFFVVFLSSYNKILLKLFHFDLNTLHVYITDSFAVFGAVSAKDPHYTLMNFIILSVVCLVLFCYLLSFHIIFKNIRKTNRVYIILSLGFISYLSIIKSPTIYASWLRPATMVYVAIAISETLTFSHYYGQTLYKKSKDYSLILLIALFVILSIHTLRSQFVTEFRRAQQFFDSGDSRVMVLNGLHLNKLVIGDKI